MRGILIALCATLGLLGSPTVAMAASDSDEIGVCEACEALLELSLAHPRRVQDRARDKWRHPAETLAFFKVRPGMTVVDFTPSAGWYTRVLVPYLGKGGHYIALNPAVPAGAPQGLANFLGGLSDKFPPEAAKWNLPGTSVEAFNTDQMGVERDGTVDRVLIFREMHNLVRNGLLRGELLRLRALLKPGGLLGIEQHRARADAPAAYVTGDKGYMRQQDVIGLVEAHGFELVASSEINSNPADPANHAGGVWELAPALRTGREELRAIGESDRMTLLFRKRP